MAYSTNNSSSVISVTNFGARGDGVSNDTNAIQAAINSLYPKKGGTIIFPPGNYVTSGALTITGNNISLDGGNRGAKIVSYAGAENVPDKIAIRDCSGVSIHGLGVYGGREAGTTLRYTGMIELSNTTGTIIDNCDFRDTVGISMYLLKNQNNIKITNNTFSNFPIAFFNNVFDATGSQKFVSLNNNTFTNAFISDFAYGGAIKIESPNGFNSNYAQECSYWDVSDNQIDITGSMGVELWGHCTDSVVSRNRIIGSEFGISIANYSRNVTVSDNIVRSASTSYAGIEVADAKDVVVANNNLRGSNASVGIIGDRSVNVNIANNIVNNYDRGIKAYFSVSGFFNINGNLVSSSGAGGTPLYLQGSNHINVVGNTLKNEGSGTYFIFLDNDNDVPMSGVYISQNVLAGSVSQWGILYYNNGRPANIYNSLIENNRTTDVKYCLYGMVNTDAAASALHQNNYGPTGGADYTISDFQIPAGSTPYASDSIQNGYQFYGRSSITIPGSGIPYTSGAWVNISSGDLGGNGVTQRFVIKYDGLGPPYTFDNRQENLEFYTTITPYELNSYSITAMPSPNYFGGVVSAIVVDNTPTAQGNVWINIRSGSAATSGYGLYVYGSDDLLVTSPVVQFARPDFTATATKLDLDLSERNTFRTTYGVTIGTGASQIYSPSSGELRVSTAWRDRMTFSSDGNIGVLANLRFVAINQSTSFSLSQGTYRYIWSGAMDCTGTLPDPSVTSGIEFMVKNLSPTGSLVLSGFIDYSQNYSLTPMQGVTLWSDNTSWLLV